jgi:hypothetical protein
MIVGCAGCMDLRQVGSTPGVYLQVADQAGNSAVYGVIPRALAPREISGELIGEIQVVEDMHTRKVRCCCPCHLNSQVVCNLHGPASHQQASKAHLVIRDVNTNLKRVMDVLSKTTLHITKAAWLVCNHL